jgi:hypothetical protein
MTEKGSTTSGRIPTLLRRLKKPFLWFVAAVVAFTLLGVFALPYLIRPVLEKRISRVLHREVTIKSLSFNPYRLIVTASNVLIKDRAGPEPFITCDELHVNYELVSIFKRAAVSSEFKLRRPYVRIVRFKDGSYNFSDLLEKKEPETPSQPIRFSAGNIQIVNGSLDFVDEPEATRHEVRQLILSIPFISNIPYYEESYIQPHFYAKINGTPYTMQGETKVFADTHETNFDITFTGLDLPHYLPYAPFKLGFTMPSGQMDASINLKFSEPKGKQSALTLAGTVALRQIAINDMQKGPILRLPRLDLSIAAAQPLLRAFHLSKVVLQSPEVYVNRSKAGTLNVQELLPPRAGPAQQTADKKATKEGSAVPLLVQVDDFELAGGKISFQDLAQGKPFKTVLQPIDVKVTQFDTGKDKKSTAHLSIRSEADEEIELDSEFSLEPLAAEGTLSLKSLTLRKYAPYYSDKVLFDILDGRLDLATRYRYAGMEKEAALNLSGLGVTLRTLRLKKENEKDEFLSIPGFAVKDTEIDLKKQDIKIGEITTDKGQIRVKRDKDGLVNLLNLLTPPPSGAAHSATSETRVAQETKVVKPSEREWLVTLKQAVADRYTVTFEDLQPSERVSISATNMKLRAENMSTAKGSKGKVSFSTLLDNKGSVSAAGAIGADPMSGSLNVMLKNIDIAPFQAYFTDRVKIRLTGGDISTSGNLKFGLAPGNNKSNKQDNKQESQLQASFSGEISVNRFSSVDKIAAADFLKWGSLALTGMNVTYNPTQVDIKGVALTDFYARILINPDRTINLSQIFTQQNEKQESAVPAQTAAKGSAAPGNQESVPKAKIESVTLQGGEIDFADKSVKPNYAVNLSEIGGRISGLSSDESTAADVELRGKMNQYAPLEITGKINPLGKDLFVDLKAGFKDFDLSPTSPYAGKYAGYTVERGKLSLDVKYHIVNRKLDSENHVTIDQFNFGERVDSPDATKLPVRLAVALLKDRNGTINLDLPVSGSLDDPQFSIGRIILKIIVNLLTKAATSPFALLGAVFGHGEELSYIEFDYGSSAVSAQNQQKIDAMAKALSDRPALKLDIEGLVDAEKDREALKQVKFMRKLKVIKFNELAKKGQAPASADQVTIEPGEYEKYLKAAYKEEKFPKPRDFVGFAKSLPVPEMEKLMLTHTEVTDDDLLALASHRAAVVRDLILKSGHIDAERLFMVEPKSVAPEKGGKLKNSRVVFKLR